MISTILVVLLAVATIAALYGSSERDSGRMFGLNGLGQVLLVVAVLSAGFSVVKEVRGTLAAEASVERQETLVEQTDEVEPELKAARALIDELNDKLDVANKQGDKLSEQLDAANDQVDKLSERLDDLINGRVKELETALANVDSYARTIHEKSTYLKTRLVDYMRTDPGAHEHQRKDLDDRCNDLLEAVNGILAYSGAAAGG